MTEKTEKPLLISPHPSTSGLQIALHPLALLTISDYITRHTLRNQSGPIVGALLGSQSGREIAIEYAYEILIVSGPGGGRSGGGDGDESAEIVFNREWFETKLALFKETHPAADLLGWFTTTESLQFTPTPSHIQFHQKLLLYNESLIFLMINPSPIATLGGCGKLPVVIYESVYENDESENAINLLRLKFVPLKYTIESGEAEMIGMDFIAKGAGNATAKTSKAEESKGASAGTAPPQNVPAPGNDNGETKPGTESKGKDKENETSTAGKEESSSKSSAGTQNDELLSNLTSKKNAIVMLNTRIKLLLRYLKNPPDGRPNHQILREIQSLTNSRLPLLRPADIKAFEQEKMAEACDVNLVVLLGVMTKSIEDVRKAGRKFSGVEVILKTAGKGTTSNFEDTIEVFVGGGNGTGGSGTGGGGGGGGGMGSLGGGPVRERRSARGITGGGGVGGGSGGGSDGAFSGIFGL